MAHENVMTMNLSDNGEGMVPLNNNPTTTFKQNEAYIQHEKNVSEHKETMDSTPINDIMMEPPMMAEEPRMQDSRRGCAASINLSNFCAAFRSPSLISRNTSTNASSSCRYTFLSSMHFRSSFPHVQP